MPLGDKVTDRSIPDAENAQRAGECLCALGNPGENPRNVRMIQVVQIRKKKPDTSGDTDLDDYEFPEDDEEDEAK